MFLRRQTSLAQNVPQRVCGRIPLQLISNDTIITFSYRFDTVISMLSDSNK